MIAYTVHFISFTLVTPEYFINVYQFCQQYWKTFHSSAGHSHQLIMQAVYVFNQNSVKCFVTDRPWF
jgi:hypothetical protein